MKNLNLKPILFCIIALITISSCSFIGDDNSKIIGTWLVNSDNEAEWIGKENPTKSFFKSKTKQKSSSDTLLFETPNGNTLELVHKGKNEFDENEEVIGVTYVDSAVTQDTVDAYNLDLSRTNFSFTGVKIGAKPFRLNVKITNVNNSAAVTKLEFLYTCGMGNDDVEKVTYTFMKRQGEELEPYKTFSFTTEGFREVVEDQFCN